VINYTEKGFGLHKDLANKGVFIEQAQTGEWVSNASDEYTNSLIEAYNPWPVEKAKKFAEINNWFESQVELVLKDIPKIEQNSWHKQVSEARGLQPLSMLIGIASVRGIPVEELVAKVLAKEEAFSNYYALKQGERDRVETLIKALPDEGEYHRLPELWALSCMV
jgi:hypothetical protein